MLQRFFAVLLSVVFFLQSFLIETPFAHAGSSLLSLPATNQMLALSKPLQPVMLQGLRYDPQTPFQFEFILQQGDHPLPLDKLRDQGMDLVRYFMAAMTMSRDDLWVNLSPYEKNRIIPASLGVTRLGSDMLVQDYILKQLASSLTFPDSKTGSDFWQKIYKETQARFGRTDIPVSTFNKVWIMPDYAEVLVKDNTVVITDSHLKVMMEQDYLAQKKASCGASCLPVTDIYEEDKGQNLASDVMRQVIIPILEKEVNTGSHFAALRQMFHAVVLAEWYKRNLKKSVFGQYYANRHKVAGINEVNVQAKEAIYKRYLSAYKKGVYNFIREDPVPGTGEIIPRKYFSGGLNFDMDPNMIHEKSNAAQLSAEGRANLRKNAYFLNVGELPAQNPSISAPNSAMSAEDIAEIRNIFNTTQVALSEERRVSPKVQIAMEATDPLVIPLVVEHPVEKIEGWEKVKIRSGFIDFCHSRIGLNIYRPNNEFLEDGSTVKGGIRYYVEGSTLMKEDTFEKGWNRLNALKAPIEVFRKFISLYMSNGGSNLAFQMFEKVQLLDLPLGGAKADVFIGNVIGEPGNITIQDLTEGDLTEAIGKIAQRHGEILAPYVGVGKDSPAPDVGTANLMGIYAEAHIRWAIKNNPIEFKDAELIGLLKNKLIEVEANPAKYPIGKTPLLALLDDYGTKRGVSVPTAVYTGTKEFGGLIGREDATGIGVITVLIAYFIRMGINYKGMKISLQGMGAVGFYAALAAAQEGFIVTDWSDNRIAVAKKDGWTAGQLEGLMKARAYRPDPNEPVRLKDWWKLYLEDEEKPLSERIFALPGVEAIINQEPKTIEGKSNPKYKELDKKISDAVIGADVDILIPAYLGNQITQANWSIVKAKYIDEGANRPTDSYAAEALTRRGHIIFKGILANSNGVFGSYLQLLQSLRGRKFTLEEVRQMSFDKLTKVTNDVIDILEKHPEMNFGEACELLAWTNAARARLRILISFERGDLNSIMNYYENNVTEVTMKRRIIKLGLTEYLYKVQAKHEQELQLSILEQLKTANLRQLATQLKDKIGQNLNLYQIRTLNRILGGEKVSEAVKRLATSKYTVPMVRALRSELLAKIKETLPGVLVLNSPENTLYMFLQKRIEELDDVLVGAPSVDVPLELLAAASNVTSGIRPSASAAMAATNGGIDFDASHMLINQSGEVLFQAQIMPSNGSEWQEIEGLSPIFLSLQPVNVPALMGMDNSN